MQLSLQLRSFSWWEGEGGKLHGVLSFGGLKDIISTEDLPAVVMGAGVIKAPQTLSCSLGRPC